MRTLATIGLLALAACGPAFEPDACGPDRVCTPFPDAPPDPTAGFCAPA